MGQFEIRGSWNYCASAFLLCDNGNMGELRKKRPRDPLSLAKLIGDIATGQVENREQDNRDPVAVQFGRLGGLKGGKARATKLSQLEKRNIAKKAAQKRWAKRGNQPG